METDLVLIDGNPSMKVVSAPSTASTPTPPPPPPAPPQPIQRLPAADGQAHLRHDFLWNMPPPPEPNWNIFGAPASHDCNCNTDLACGSKQKRDFGVMPPPPPPMPMTMPPTLMKSCLVPPPPQAQPPKKSKKKAGLVFPPSSPSPLPPPPPPMPGTHVLHVPPPPPPPPMSSSNDLTRVSTPGELVPTVFSGDSFTDRSEVVRLTPFNKDVFLTVHKAYAVDFDTHMWLLKYGMMETWYNRPSKATLKVMAKMESCDCEPEPLKDVHHDHDNSDSRHGYRLAVANLEVPKVCASSALTTPTDDDIYDCEHDENDGTEACYQCTDEKSEALEKTPLAYFLILSTYLKFDDFGPPTASTKASSKRVYKYIRCGSREAAAAETYHAAGVNGWDIVFSCVMRFGETFEERSGPVERVEDLSKLIDGVDDEDTIRVFY